MGRFGRSQPSASHSTGVDLSLREVPGVEQLPQAVQHVLFDVRRDGVASGMVSYSSNPRGIWDSQHAMAYAQRIAKISDQPDALTADTIQSVVRVFTQEIARSATSKSLHEGVLIAAIPNDDSADGYDFVYLHANSEMLIVNGKKRKVSLSYSRRLHDRDPERFNCLVEGLCKALFEAAYFEAMRLIRNMGPR